MTRNLEITDIVDDRDRILVALRRFIDRRANDDAGEIVPPDRVPSALRMYAPGERYGRYRETITRWEVRREGIPSWFDPREHEGQFGIIGSSGLRCYIEVALDVEARSAPSTFDSQILELVDRTPEQTALF